MEPILNLSPQEFRAALAELQLDPQREADLVRLYEEANAPQQGGRDRGMLRNLLDNIIGFDDEVVTPGERLGAGVQQFAGGLLSNPVGTAGDIVRGGYETIERAMAPGATPMDVMGAAGMAMGAGGLLTRPAGSVGMGGRVAPDARASDWLDDLRSRYPDAQIDVSGGPGRGYTVSRIVVPEDARSQGLGTQIMREITDIADSQGATVALTPSSDFGGNVSRLRDFYGRMGFVANTGRNRDMSISEDMYREPISANRSTTTGLLASAASETPAQQVARLLREGRADEVTDDLMAQADPQEMFRLYEAGETGMDLPLDRQSRFQRAREMGFDVNNILYHGTAADFPAFDASRGGSVTGARSARAATWLSDDPDVAQGYAAFAADRAVQDLIDRSYRAEVDGDFDLAERLMREAERVEAAGVEGANIISAYGPRNLRRVDMAGEQYDPDDMSLSGLLSKAQQSGASGLELTEFIDNADFANMRSASHRGIFNPANIRSEFARFDPRLSNLRNLSAANVDPLTGAVAVSASQQDDPLANLRAYIAAAGGVLPR
jgi:GNAT superfamily N-acetyltransferase